MSRSLREVEHALPSLAFGLAMGLATTVHHLHAALAMRSTGPGLHVVWTEAVLMPVTVASMALFLRRGSRCALGVYATVTALGLVGLGLYEGAWNHGAKVIAHLRLGCPRACPGAILPAGDPHAWFHEITGVATGVLALCAARSTWRLVRGAGVRCTSCPRRCTGSPPGTP